MGTGRQIGGECRECGKIFTYSRAAQRRPAKFCSMACYRLAQRSGLINGRVRASLVATLKEGQELLEVVSLDEAMLLITVA